MNEAGLLGQTRRFTGTEVIRPARGTVERVPMICILFFSVRLRAMQLDPLVGQPPAWMQQFFYVCTVSVFVQMLAIFCSLTGLYEQVNSLEVGTSRGAPLDIKATFVEVVRALALALQYLSVVALIIGMYGMTAPGGVHKPMPTSLNCIMLLSAMYFLVYLARWGVETVMRCTRAQGGPEWNIVSEMFVLTGVHAKQAVDHSHMFSILFLGSLLRALQITGGKGGVPWFSQFMQVLAAFTIAGLSLVRLDIVLARGEEYRALRALCTILQYMLMLILYVSAVAVIVSLFRMTPESALAAAQ